MCMCQQKILKSAPYKSRCPRVYRYWHVLLVCGVSSLVVNSELSEPCQRLITRNLVRSTTRILKQESHGHIFIKHLKSNVYVTLNAIGSDVTYVLIGWFKFLLLKFLYEYGPWSVFHHSCVPLGFRSFF